MNFPELFEKVIYRERDADRDVDEVVFLDISVPDKDLVAAVIEAIDESKSARAILKHLEVDHSPAAFQESVAFAHPDDALNFIERDMGLVANELSGIYVSALQLHAIKTKQQSDNVQRLIDLSAKKSPPPVDPIGKSMAQMAYKDRKQLKDKINKFFDPCFLYAHAESKLGDKDDEARDALRNIRLMKPDQMRKLLAILPGSYFEYVDVKADNPLTRQKLDAAVSTYKEHKPSPDVIAALGSPANQNSPYRNLSTRNESLHSPVSNALIAPDRSTGGLVVLNDAMYPKIDNRTVSSRLLSEMVAYKNVVDYIKKNNFSEKNVDSVLTSALYVIEDPDGMPDPIWTRATVKAIQSDDSTALNKRILSVSAYTLRAGATRTDTNPDFNDAVVNSNLATVPACAYSSEQSSLFMVLMASDEGAAVIKKYEDNLKKNYPSMDSREYFNYLRFASSLASVESRCFECYNIEQNTKVSPDELVGKFGGLKTAQQAYDNEMFPKVRKALAVNQAIRTVISEELSLCGIVQLVPIAILRELYNPVDLSVTVINAHDLVESAGFTVDFSDGNSGQDLNGKFVPVKANQGVKYEIVNVGHGYGDPVDRLTPYIRRGFALRGKSGKKPVLIDLTVNGLLYNPQREEDFKLKKEYLSQQLLTGSYGASCLYSLEQLSTQEAFVVHIGPGFFTVGEGSQKMQRGRELALFLKTFYLTLTPTSVTDWWGAYLVGVRVSGTALVPRPLRKLIGEFVTLGILKAKAVANGLTCYVPEIKSIHADTCNFLQGYPKTLESLRKVGGKQIGTQKAYEDFVNVMNQKNEKFVDLVHITDQNAYFSAEYNQNLLKNVDQHEADQLLELIEQLNANA